MKLPAWLAFIHKWLGLIVGIQIVLWMAGGFIMSFLDLDVVHGDHNVAEQEEHFLTGQDMRMPLSVAIALYAPEGVRQASYQQFFGHSFYDLHLADGRHVIVDPSNGLPMSLGEDAIRVRAEADFSGDGSIAEMALIERTNGEYRGPVPVWRVRFDDPEDTRLYISPETGRVMSRRNGSWRLFDFFWKLHIMDWDDGEDFNTWWLVTTSILALFICLLGYGLMFYRLKLKDWRVMFRSKN